ncbi:MAG: D-alanyl-D-alanine carboxypeptidase family protein [Lysinibacillus sp.]
MRKSRANRRKSNKPLFIGVTVIAILVLAAAGLYVYRDAIFPNQNGEGKKTSTEAVEQNTPEEVEEPVDAGKSEVEEEANREEQAQPSFTIDEGGYPVEVKEATEPTYINGVLIANKKYPLPKNFNPGEDPEAKAALDQMVAAAKAAGFDLVAFSGYRSYEYQTQLYTNYTNRDGKEAADRYSARPGHSEHQTGLAFDIGEVGREDVWLTEEFGETPAGKWLAQNAHMYGFILRFPKGEEDVTGFMYESWHFRYLGKDLAEKVYKAGVALEEYLGIE